jgi:hypothetical protein
MNKEFTQCGSIRSSPSLWGCNTKSFTKKGVENRVSDALSRRSHDIEELCLISSASPKWLSSVQSNYDEDPIAKDNSVQVVIAG